MHFIFLFLTGNQAIQKCSQWTAALQISLTHFRTVSLDVNIQALKTAIHKVLCWVNSEEKKSCFLHLLSNKDSQSTLKPAGEKQLGSCLAALW